MFRLAYISIIDSLKQTEASGDFNTYNMFFNEKLRKSRIWGFHILDTPFRQDTYLETTFMDGNILFGKADNYDGLKRPIKDWICGDSFQIKITKNDETNNSTLVGIEDEYQYKMICMKNDDIIQFTHIDENTYKFSEIVIGNSQIYYDYAFIFESMRCSCQNSSGFKFILDNF